MSGSPRKTTDVTPSRLSRPTIAWAWAFSVLGSRMYWMTVSTDRPCAAKSSMASCFSGPNTGGSCS